MCCPSTINGVANDSAAFAEMESLTQLDLVLVAPRQDLPRRAQLGGHNDQPQERHEASEEGEGGEGPQDQDGERGGDVRTGKGK